MRRDLQYASLINVSINWRCYGKTVRHRDSLNHTILQRNLFFFLVFIWLKRTIIIIFFNILESTLIYLLNSFRIAESLSLLTYRDNGIPDWFINFALTCLREAMLQMNKEYLFIVQCHHISSWTIVYDLEINQRYKLQCSLGRYTFL